MNCELLDDAVTAPNEPPSSCVKWNHSRKTRAGTIFSLYRVTSTMSCRTFWRMSLKKYPCSFLEIPGAKRVQYLLHFNTNSYIKSYVGSALNHGSRSGRITPCHREVSQWLIIELKFQSTLLASPRTSPYSEAFRNCTQTQPMWLILYCRCKTPVMT